MKILVCFLISILLLGATTASSLNSANFVNAQGNNNQADIIMPNQQQQQQSQQPAIDLNEQEKTTLANLLIECPSGLFVYTGVNGQLVIACLIDGAYGKLFNKLGQEILNININSHSDNGNDNHDDKKGKRDHHHNDGPDRDCLFKPSLPKCESDNGECPDGFFQNGYEQCVPNHSDGCPDGYHSVDDDETGQCIKDSKGCPDGMEFRPDRKTCTYIEEEEPQTDTGNSDGDNSTSSNDNDEETPLTDVVQNPIISPTDINTEDSGPINEDDVTTPSDEDIEETPQQEDNESENQLDNNDSTEDEKETSGDNQEENEDSNN